MNGASMANLTLSKSDKVNILKWQDGGKGNVFNAESLSEWTAAALDEVESTRGNTSLVLTSDDPKFYSSGLDVAWLMTQSDPMTFIRPLENFMLRLSLLNMPVVTAINGHAYAGGAVLASTADFRYMRADRGRFCFFEVKVNLPFTHLLTEVIKLLHPHDALYELAITGDAWGGDQCAARGIVSAAVSADALMPHALDRACALSHLDRKTFTAIKRGLRSTLLGFAQQRGISLPE